MEKILKKIKDHLQSCSNPLYFYDDDPDGLSAFLLLKKFCGGKGIVTKAGPILDESYLHYIEENKPDLVVILDKALVTQEFLDQIKSCPVIWIDHHGFEKRKNVIYLNPKIWNKDDNRCTTYWAYRLVGGPLWIACVGITSDWFIPEQLNEFRKEYPGYVTKKPKSPTDLLFNSKLGDLIKIFVFSLKGNSEEVKKSINCLIKIEHPDEIIKQTSPQGTFIYKRAMNLKREYDDLLNRAIECKTKEKILLFIYREGKNSYTSFLSNELLYNFNNKFIILGRESNGEVKISMRYKEPIVEIIIKKALEGVEGYGGGHPNACGGKIKKHDFNKFIDSIKEQLKNEREIIKGLK